jgi:hypothetical protein
MKRGRDMAGNGKTKWEYDRKKGCELKTNQLLPQCCKAASGC